MTEGVHVGEGGEKVSRQKEEHLGPINSGGLESGFSLFPVPANSKLEQVYYVAGSGTCVHMPQAQGKAGISLGCDAQSTWRTGFVLALGYGSESQLSKHQSYLELSYTKKYLELKNISCERLIGRGKESDLLPVSHIPCISHCQFFYGKNPPHLDNRYKENRFVWSNHTVKCSGLAPLCSLFLHWPRAGKFLNPTLRHALFAKTRPVHMACDKAVTGRAKPGSFFS